eukprot:CAMPEP_0114659906 /NCGR_PEP_ID=MMETSP0191-20121206/18822_1 /TAXON_ID=126664 /ORGANISM="Sorites sp." /LENGTH=485 /DNA_ID=CAMNT_0001886609 /DNA_START=745 /DNA_END=2199 /DNA_ORIENTATION=-
MDDTGYPMIKVAVPRNNWHIKNFPGLQSLIAIPNNVTSINPIDNIISNSIDNVVPNIGNGDEKIDDNTDFNKSKDIENNDEKKIENEVPIELDINNNDENKVDNTDNNDNIPEIPNLSSPGQIAMIDKLPKEFRQQYLKMVSELAKEKENKNKNKNINNNDIIDDVVKDTSTMENNNNIINNTGTTNNGDDDDDVLNQFLGSVSKKNLEPTKSNASNKKQTTSDETRDFLDKIDKMISSEDINVDNNKSKDKINNVNDDTKKSFFDSLDIGNNNDNVTETKQLPEQKKDNEIIDTFASSLMQSNIKDDDNLGNSNLDGVNAPNFTQLLDFVDPKKAGKNVYKLGGNDVDDSINDFTAGNDEVNNIGTALRQLGDPTNNNMNTGFGMNPNMNPRMSNPMSNPSRNTIGNTMGNTMGNQMPNQMNNPMSNPMSNNGMNSQMGAGMGIMNQQMGFNNNIMMKKEYDAMIMKEIPPGPINVNGSGVMIW